MRSVHDACAHEPLKPTRITVMANLEMVEEGRRGNWATTISGEVMCEWRIEAKLLLLTASILSQDWPLEQARVGSKMQLCSPL